MEVMKYEGGARGERPCASVKPLRTEQAMKTDVTTEPKPAAVQLQRILVALDAGKLSEGAVRRGLELKRMFGGKLDLVHAVGLPGAGFELMPDPSAVAKGTDPITKIREAIIAQVRGWIEPTESERERAAELVQVIAGQPAKVIVECARESKSDLIVLGSLRHRSAFDFGSTARAVLAKAPCAVWVQPGPPTPIRRILVPIDFSAESMIALATATSFAKRVGASITAVHVFDVRQYGADQWDGITMYVPIDDLRQTTQEEFAKAMAEFDWQGVEHDTNFAGGLPAEQILELAKSADLILMGTHGRTGFASAVLGSVAYSVLKRADRPVMVVRQLRRKFAS